MTRWTRKGRNGMTDVTILDELDMERAHWTDQASEHIGNLVAFCPSNTPTFFGAFG